MERVTPERATDAIFTGEFDHWGDLPTGKACIECDLCALRIRPIDVRVFQLHLSHSHLDDVINALEDRT